MTTSTTGLRPPPESNASPSTIGQSEPEVLKRQRAVLRQVLALVAEPRSGRGQSSRNPFLRRSDRRYRIRQGTPGAR